MLREITLGAADLDRLYPHHLVIDAQMRVVGAGRVLRRLLPELSTAPLLNEVFVVERPQDIADFASICRSRESTFLLRARGNKEVKLKGGVLPVAGEQRAVLLTVLWFSDPAAFDVLNLDIGDFAPSDTAVRQGRPR